MSQKGLHTQNVGSLSQGRVMTSGSPVLFPHPSRKPCGLGTSSPQQPPPPRQSMRCPSDFWRKPEVTVGLTASR